MTHQQRIQKAKKAVDQAGELPAVAPAPAVKKPAAKKKPAKKKTTAKKKPVKV